jgi:hypothetical protein
MKVVAEVVHTCWSFSKIQQWAWNRRIRENFDKNKVIMDDPLGWGTYTYVPRMRYVGLEQRYRFAFVLHNS